jgi:hypothetical protein
VARLFLAVGEVGLVLEPAALRALVAGLPEPRLLALEVPLYLLPFALLAAFGIANLRFLATGATAIQSFLFHRDLLS